MKKNGLFFSTSLIVFFVFFNSLVYAKKEKTIEVELSFSWQQQSYAPELDIQPYFDFSMRRAWKELLCNSQTIPFAEGFNSDSTTFACWTIVDEDKDLNFWTLDPYLPFEGDREIYIRGARKSKDWLISPTLKMDKTKTYKLTYAHKTSAFNESEIEVLASNNGLATVNFTKVIVSKRVYNNDNWELETAYITNLGGDVNLGWKLTAGLAPSVTAIQYLDNVIVEEVACVEPMDLGVKLIKNNQVTIFWNDKLNTTWEYYIDTAAGNGVVSAGTATTNSEVVVTKDHNNINLVAGQSYEFYVRAKCANGQYGEWVGPYSFTAQCVAVPLPFTERFNSDSTTFNCWRLLDANRNKTTDGVNSWTRRGGGQYEGDRALFFVSKAPTAVADDWLISPKLQFNGGLYAVTYYYKTDGLNSNDFEVVLSTTGTEPSDFSTVLEASTRRNTATYVKKVLYVKNITADVHIAWHVVAKGAANVQIDFITVEEISCIAPEEKVVVSDLGVDSAKLTWLDSNNSNWEYVVQPSGGGLPVSSGNLIKTTSLTVNKITGVGGTNLQPNSNYDFFVRASCGLGKASFWIGPISFRTLCVPSGIPFWEGFNTNSQTASCWIKVDNSKLMTTVDSWFSASGVGNFEGNGKMNYSSAAIPGKHDDWLISPTFNLDPTKFYRLRYHYKTLAGKTTDFEVKSSNKGVGVEQFTKTLLVRKGYSNDVWREEVVVIQGVSGDFNFAWHVTTENKATSLYIDNVFLEELTGCPEAYGLDTKDETVNSATIFWVDDFGKNWEYVVQKAGGIPPTGNVVATNQKEHSITQDKNGNKLKANTDYEFYVRTICGPGNESVWMGPYQFRTNCGVFDTPFWEGFNTGSPAIGCWTTRDANRDAIDTYLGYQWNVWRIEKLDHYEGNQSMYYTTTNNMGKDSDDWLISPNIKFDKGKTYRLKYHFKTEVENGNSEFEVLASNKGTELKDFTKVILKNQFYKVADYQEKVVFIQDLVGEVNLAWHVGGYGPKNLYIENVFVEEVIGCPEPIELGVKDQSAKKSTIYWTDDMGGSHWEYYVQDLRQGVPKQAGTAVNKKEGSVSKDQSGKNLIPNSEYEFYVRTVCGDGTYSIWSGPFEFRVPCDIYKAPFWEGFNTDSETLSCWTIVDVNNDEMKEYGINIFAPIGFYYYEGNQAMTVVSLDFTGSGLGTDDWVISPDLDMDNSDYVLKYHYKTDAIMGCTFDVSLSNQGVALDKFTHKIVGSADYNNASWKEEVKFFKGVPGVVNIAWHNNTAGDSELSLDNVTIKKVETCPEPYYLKISNQTSTGMDVAWQQNGGVNEWELLVMNYGDDVTATPVQKMSVTVNPKATITGLVAGKVYAIFVRAKCTDGKTHSDWSTPAYSATKVGLNDDCVGAVNVPVNNTLDCVKFVSGSLIGSTQSVTPLANCYMDNTIKDVWFEFTATTKTHMLSLKDLKSVSGVVPIFLQGTLYEDACGTMTRASLGCFLFSLENNRTLLMNLVPGKKYYYRIGTPETAPDYIFNICITTSTYTPVEVSPSGDKYTVEQLVKDVLVKSNCDLVSNVKYQVGDGSAATQTVNTLGYFNKGGSVFPFDDGIVLSTNEVKYVPGPHIGADNPRGQNPHRWTGDKDINDAINAAGGGPTPDKRVTQLEFDFTPIKEEINFDFLFASNSYKKGCGSDCDTGALFAAWLVDTTTGEGQNLAKIKGTNTPIALNTIRDAKRSGITCNSMNPEYYWKHYDNHQDNPFDAPIDFVGMTKAMQSETVKVVPGRKYHIKLAVMDFCPNDNHSSAVFFKAGSFDLGNLDLGEDLLVENGNALCGGDSRTIKSGLGDEDVLIQWYKDEVLIPGAAAPDLEVTESGTYKVVAKYAMMNCEVIGQVKVEIFPAISTAVLAPQTIEVCRYSFKPIVIDLSDSEIVMFSKTESKHYQTAYFKDKNEAASGTNPIGTTYEVNAEQGNTDLYVRVEDIRTGCSEVFVLPIKISIGKTPSQREDVIVCESYVFPELESNQYYYTEAGGKGASYKAGDVLSGSETQTIYVLQDNGASCYEEIFYKVSITAPVSATVFEDVELECTLHVLAPLPVHNKYFTQSAGQGIELTAGSLVPIAQTIYVFAASEDGLCTDESSFNVSYRDCPIQKGISPNGDGLNDRFDLAVHGVSSIVIYNRYGAEVYSFQGNYIDQWYGQEKAGKLLPDGTYYYVVIARGKTRTGWVQINR